MIKPKNFIFCITVLATSFALDLALDLDLALATENFTLLNIDKASQNFFSMANATGHEDIENQIFALDNVPERKTTEYIYLRNQCVENDARVVPNLAYNFVKDTPEKELICLLITETIYTIFLSRTLTAAERMELLERSYISFDTFTDYIKSKDPKKYPAATSVEREEFRQMIKSLKDIKVELLPLVYYGRRDRTLASKILGPIVKKLNPISIRLHQYNTEYDSRYRRAVILEYFLVQLVLFIVKAPNDYTQPKGISVILAQQSKRMFSDLLADFKETADENTNISKLSQIMVDIQCEAELLVTYDILNGKLSLETDKVLQEIRQEYVRLGFDPELLNNVYVHRMERRMTMAFNSVDHVLKDINHRRLIDGIPAGTKLNKPINLITDKERYFLSYLVWVTDIAEWEIQISPETEHLFALMDNVRWKIIQLKTLALTVALASPNETFWDEF